MAPGDGMDWTRYAIYWLPDGTLGRTGADWLGWDARTGHGDGMAAPARYGFHATVKPPFRLADGMTQEGLREAARALADHLFPTTLGKVAVRRLGHFLALVPDHNPVSLAATVVEGLDAFRAPPPATELERRRVTGLTPAQDALLVRWGYPYVMEEFRMHLTLTGRDSTGAAQARAEAVFAPHAGPHRIDRLTLVGEDGEGRFHMIEDLPLGGHAET